MDDAAKRFKDFQEVISTRFTRPMYGGEEVGSDNGVFLSNQTHEEVVIGMRHRQVL